MQMRPLFTALAIGVSIACVASFANAQQIYKWKDANGVTHFSQTPPASGKHYTKMQLSGAPEVSSNPAPAKNNTEAQPQDQDNNAPAAARNSAKTQPDTASNRAKLCKQLSSNVALLQTKQPVVTDGANGKQQVMSDNTREQQLATARAQQTQYCSAH
ncbi:MAG: DUF4124 domain-containing protein [Rhodanobacteraceae bacterium]